MNRADLQWLANERIAEAKALIVAKRWAGAYYLAGYAVECALKACIAGQMKANEFPDKKLATSCFTHDLEQLLGLAGLTSDMKSSVAADPELLENWRAVEVWDEESRYKRNNSLDAKKLVKAVHGVLKWLKERW